MATDAVLLLLVAISMSSRDPPDAVLEGETVAIRSNIRQGDPSPSTDWRNDPSQSKASRIFSRVHSLDFSFSLHPFLNSSQLSSLIEMLLFRMIWTLLPISTFPLTCSNSCRNLPCIPRCFSSPLPCCWGGPHPCCAGARHPCSHGVSVTCVACTWT